MSPKSLLIVIALFLFSFSSKSQRFYLDAATIPDSRPRCHSDLYYGVENFMKIIQWDSAFNVVPADFSDITLRSDSAKLVRQNDSLYLVFLLYKSRECGIDVIRISTGEKIGSIRKHCEVVPYRFRITYKNTVHGSYPYTQIIDEMTTLMVIAHAWTCFDYKKVYTPASYQMVLQAGDTVLTSMSLDVAQPIPEDFKKEFKRLLHPGVALYARNIVLKNKNGSDLVVDEAMLLYVPTPKKW